MNSSSLTNREQEIMEYLRKGATNYEIADALSISIATVKVHVRNIRSKLGIQGRGRIGSRLPHVPMEITPKGYGLSSQHAYSVSKGSPSSLRHEQIQHRILSTSAIAAVVQVCYERLRNGQMNVSLERILTPLMFSVVAVLTVGLMILLVPVILVAVPVWVFFRIVLGLPVAAIAGRELSDLKPRSRLRNSRAD